MTAPDGINPPNVSAEPPIPAGGGPGQPPPYPPYPPYTQPGAGASPAYAPRPSSEVPSACAEQYPRPAGEIPGPPKRRSGFAWLWWVVGIVLLMAVIVGFASLIALLAGSTPGGLPTGNVVAVIPFDGTIAGSGAGPNVITPESFLKKLERAEDDPNVKAIVLRVNSPGGTVAASEEIATYVKQASKPVVVSVGDVDASGAYMVSSQASRIVAGPGSAIGSIGVIMEIPNVSGLMDKVGVSFKVLTAGKYKDAGSPFRELTPVETAMLQGQIDQVYGQFIDIVAEGRDLPRSEVESMATGWAWNGQEAKKMHLVDEIGTYKTALAVAAKLGNIPEGRYKEEVYSNADSLNSLLSSLVGIESQLKAIAASNPVHPTSAGGAALPK